MIANWVLIHKHKINRNEEDITISLFNKYFKKTLYNYPQY